MESADPECLECPRGPVASGLCPDSCFLVPRPFTRVHLRRQLLQRTLTGPLGPEAPARGPGCLRQLPRKPVTPWASSVVPSPPHVTDSLIPHLSGQVPFHAQPAWEDSQGRG